MQFTKNTSSSRNKGLLIKTLLILVVVIGVITLLGKIEFPYPNKDVEKIIPNEKFKIVK
ncbi:MAG: hypothetical protein ISQ35_00590 [Candidatus Pelagibacter bacterium]|nr:hypothetical protein [Candidatus Pelagibacter bacterium]